ncbi:MAG: ABC transporter ATP-binding protein [Candidatus Aenigmarchaeota archaeon]|nr:ABC transporter ATP-binding protein [Candidatus Aenigmarchaeota archaeon]
MVRVKLKNVSKLFEMEHESVSTLKEKFVATLERKRKRKEKIWALKDITFEAKGGECIGVIGENASGKTTLLKIIGKMLEPTRGKIIIDGKVATLLTLGIGFNTELTARENVYLYGSIMGFTKSEIDSKYNDIVEFSELGDFMDVKLKSFSDGMKVRLGFATAISIDANILLVDEVLAVGDGAFQMKCLNKFEELKRQGKIIIFVSHGLETIRKYSDKVIFIHKGKIKEFGEPDKVVESYETYLKSKELKAYNSGILEKIRNQGIMDVKFLKNDEEFWVFNSGEPFKTIVKFKLKKRPSTFFLSFVDGREIRFYSKNIKDNLVEFDVNSLPLEEGRYRFFVGYDGIKMLNYFELIVKRGEAKKDTRIFSEDLSLDKEVYAFDKDCEKIFENFEKRKTLVVFSNIEDAARDSENGTIFNNKKILFKGKTEEVVDKYKEKFCKEIIKKYGNELELK